MNIARTSRAIGACLAIVVVGAVTVIQPAPTVVHALGGGTSPFAAVALPCAPPCSFTGANTGNGLSAFPVGAEAHEHATWWSFTADASTSYTVRATPTTAWRATLVLTDADGNVLASNDDPYGRSPAAEATLDAGLEYRAAYQLADLGL